MNNKPCLTHAVFSCIADGVLLPPRVDTAVPFERLASQVNGVFLQAGPNFRFSLKEVRRFQDKPEENSYQDCLE